ncbi:hypothetical protein ACFWUU_25975 [Kribbella sp. NPDC058693]|uniref:hypothetical protein n=1 Tax=Kribbella sp. NPDC058693 TaxID=3346602 RepID=UPI00365E3A85
MRKIATTAAGIAAGVLGMGMALVPSAQAATPCPRGAVCIRETDGHILAKNIFWSFGPHNLSGVIGFHVIVNNQTNNAGFKVCKGYNGGAPCGPVNRWVGESQPSDLTTINSFVLVK